MKGMVVGRFDQGQEPGDKSESWRKCATAVQGYYEEMISLWHKDMDNVFVFVSIIPYDALYAKVTQKCSGE